MKDIKPLSSKKPPAPESDHALIEAWIAKAMPDLQEILKDLDKRICKEWIGNINGCSVDAKPEMFARYASFSFVKDPVKP